MISRISDYSAVSWAVICAILLSGPFIPADDCSAENAIALGYGLGMENGSSTGHIEGKRSYHYAAFSYAYEKPLTKRLAFVVEPFVNVVNRPDTGCDVGANLLVKAYVAELTRWSRLYVAGGGGGVYTTVGFKEQGTHALFSLQGGVGYRYDPFFVDVRFNHYSNGGLANPNRSINSCIFKVGYYFYASGGRKGIEKTSGGEE